MFDTSMLPDAGATTEPRTSLPRRRARPGHGSAGTTRRAGGGPATTRRVRDSAHAGGGGGASSNSNSNDGGWTGTARPQAHVHGDSTGATERGYEGAVARHKAAQAEEEARKGREEAELLHRKRVLKLVLTGLRDGAYSDDGAQVTFLGRAASPEDRRRMKALHARGHDAELKQLQRNNTAPGQ